MSSVYYPAHVVLVLRRIVNVISTLSISNHYLLPKNTVTDSDRGTVAQSTVNLPPSSSPLARHNELEWPWSFRRRDWNWISLGLLSTTTVPQESRAPGVPSLGEGAQLFYTFIISPQLSHPSEASSSQSLKRQWSWRSLLNTSAQTTPPDMEDLPPPSPPRRKQDQRKPLNLPLAHHPSPDPIHQLMQNPPLYNPLRTPRYPIVLCHGTRFVCSGVAKFNISKVSTDSILAVRPNSPVSGCITGQTS